MSDPGYALDTGQPVPSLADYQATGGGSGLERAVAMEPTAVIEEVRAADLRGRGGAGFPTGVKWASVAEGTAYGPVYLACNAAEGEPGTYKDRVLMARNPYQLIEGILIGMHAIGAERGFLAVKERFSAERERVLEARDAAAEAGWPGADRLDVVLGPDEYLFGEETGLLEVIEGKLPLPRVLPPYQAGLWADMHNLHPTAVNNVETLSHAARILRDGGAAFRSVGTEETPGTMLFTVVGDVRRAGVHELPMGTPLRTLLCELGGAEDIRAVFSGTSNAVITPDLLDLPMDFDSFAEAGTGLGSGGFVVYDSSRDMVQVTAALMRFLAVESCGQCPPCKVGTGDMFERLERLVAGRGTSTDIETIRRSTETVAEGNRCYLPVGAALLVRSVLDAYSEDFEARLSAPSPPERAVVVPKLEAIDLDTGEVHYDLDYHRKQGDWSYAPSPDQARVVPPSPG